MSHNVPQDLPALSDRQLRAVPFMAAAKIFADAAEDMGLPHETVSRWLTDPAFREDYEKQWDESAEVSAVKVRTRILMAVVAFAELLDSHAPEAASSRLVIVPNPQKAREERNREAGKRLKKLIADARNYNADSDRTRLRNLARPRNQPDDSPSYPVLHTLIAKSRIDT